MKKKIKKTTRKAVKKAIKKAVKKDRTITDQATLHDMLTAMGFKKAETK